MKLQEIVIVDDHSIVLSALSALLRRLPDWQVRATCTSCAELLEHLEQQGLPDIILLDVNMPETDGIETMLLLQERYGKEVNVIALSSHQELFIIQKMLNAGAKGYIPKRAQADELIYAMESVLKGKPFVSPSLSQLLVHQHIVPKVPQVTLSAVEEDIIRLVHAQKSTTEIAAVLGLSRHTVNTYRARLLGKTNSANSVGLALYGIRTGLCRL